jgi:predicted negative regulator of RcsB-dependent stress response
MANDDEEFDSYEQSERARKWFQTNGGSLVIAVLAAMALIWGYKGFQNNKVLSAEQAGLNFQAVAAAIESKNDAQISQLSTEIRKSYGATTYAALAGLAEAKYLAENGKAPAAETALRLAQNAGTSPQIQVLATLRLARLLNGQGKAQEALDLLKNVKDEGFKAQTQEQLGDAYAQLGKAVDAKAAYASALTATDLASPGRSTLQQKLDNLSG